MSGAVDPITYPQAWDSVGLGQLESPGLCEISGFDREYDWDVKKGKGAKGATITFTGQQPAKGSITFKLWTAEHFARWDTFRRALKYDPTKKTAQAIDLYHPSLDDLDVSSVVTTKIGPIKHDGGGMYSIKCEFLEYLPPPKTSAVGSPTGSKSNTGKGNPGTPPDPVGDAQQREIQRLLAEAAKP